MEQKVACQKIIKFHSVILQDMAFQMMSNIAWFTTHILAWWELKSDELLHRGQFLMGIAAARLYACLSGCGTWFETQIESTKTTSMEDVSTGILKKRKNI